MSLILIILPRAEFETEESFHFYNGFKANLGTDFLEELDEYLELILQNPKLFRENNLGFREAVLKRFPYLIIYEKIEGNLFVYSVFNTHRDPISKPKRF